MAIMLAWDPGILTHEDIEVLKTAKVGDFVVVRAGTPQAVEYYKVRIEKSMALQVTVRGFQFWRYTGKQVLQTGTQRIFPPTKIYLKQARLFAGHRANVEAEVTG